MKTAVKIMPCVIFLLTFSLYVFSEDTILIPKEVNFRPGPRLLYPIANDIKLKAKNYLEFRWEPVSFVNVEYYDFKLYKGYDAVASNIIFKKRFSYNDLPVKLPVDLFKVGQAYTWVVISVFDSGEKSEPSYSAFRIAEK